MNWAAIVASVVVLFFFLIVFYIVGKPSMFLVEPGKPGWYRMLPLHLKVPAEKLDDLEILREAFGLPDEVFMIGITMSPWAVIKVLEDGRERLRRVYPQATEKKLWEYVIVARLQQVLAGLGSSAPETISRKLESLNETVKNIHSWDDVLEFGLELHRESGNVDDPSGIQDEINRVLEGKMSSTHLQILKARMGRV